MKRTAIVVIVFLVIVVLIGCGGGGSLDGWEEDPALSLLGKNMKEVEREGIFDALAFFPVLPKYIEAGSIGFRYREDGIFTKAESISGKKWDILGIKPGMEKNKVERITGKGMERGTKEEKKFLKAFGAEWKRYEASGDSGRIRLDIDYADGKASRFVAYWAPR